MTNLSNMKPPKLVINLATKPLQGQGGGSQNDIPRMVISVKPVKRKKLEVPKSETVRKRLQETKIPVVKAYLTPKKK
jgi:hypothetical protein